MEEKLVSQEKLEEQMDEHLVRKAPFQIPETGRKFLVQWASWAALIIGLFSLISVIGLWSSAEQIDRMSQDYFDADGHLVHVVHHVGALYYLASFVLLAQGVMLLYAFFGLRARSKIKGWNILLYAVLAGTLYNLLFAFTDQGETANLVAAVLDAAIGLYLLAQCKSYYGTPKTGKK